jgi:hypothetical protein
MGIIQNAQGTPGDTQTTSTAPDPTNPLPSQTPDQLTTPTPAPTTTYTPTTLSDPTKWTTTPDQTVAGQVQKITSADSGIIQQARTRALQSMNQRGLLNSSIAQTAADSAAYDAAIPIATADAAQASKAAGYNADEQNQFAVKNQDTNTQVGLNNAQSSNQIAQANLQQQTQLKIKQLDANQQMALQDLANKDKDLIQNSSVASQAYAKYADILYSNSTNPKLDAAARAQADQNAFNTYQQQVSLAATLTGMPDVSAQLNFTGIAPAAQATTATPAAATPAAPAAIQAQPGWDSNSWNNNGGA